jgi:RimJ/RimL family protein N-acetyltransferase
VGVWNDIELDDLELRTERLILRALRGSDADAVHEAMQHRGMHEFLPLPDPYTTADAAEFVNVISQNGRRHGTGLDSALVERSSGALAGTASIRLPRGERTGAEIGYAVYPHAQGKGYAAEASRALTGWAFHHDVGRVQIRCAVRNLASAKTALNAGFRFEGVLRRDVLTPAGLRDGAVFARLLDDAGDPIAPTAPPLPVDGLSDGVVRLRVREPADLDAVLEEENDPETRRWEFTDHFPSRQRCATVLERAALDWLVGQVLRMSVVDVASGDVAGSIQLRLAGPPQVANVGYGVHPRFRGGYAGRALRLLCRWAFEQADFARLELGAKVGNVASQKAALAGGFLPDGIRARRLRNPNGSFSDEARFALVNPHYGPTAQESEC